MNMNLILEALACMLATVSFAVLLRQPKGTLIYTAIISVSGYLCFSLLGKGMDAYFVGGLLVGLACEIVARVKKVATTLFLISGIIPMVPGLGLYQTATFMAARDYEQALRTGMDTLGGLAAIALAVTLTGTLFSGFHAKNPLPPPKGE
jgi:uncharacterized membrane protein YjjB (DUF3815 family)